MCDVSMLGAGLPTSPSSCGALVTLWFGHGTVGFVGDGIRRSDCYMLESFLILHITPAGSHFHSLQTHKLIIQPPGRDPALSSTHTEIVSDDPDQNLNASQW